MIALLGLIVVFAAVLGGFAVAGGPFPVLLAWSEWVIILGTALGTAMVSTPRAVLAAMVSKSLGAFRGKVFTPALYLDSLKLLYELFTTAQREGQIAIEPHIEAPDKSKIFKRYPGVLQQHHAVEFSCDALRLVLMGSVPAHDLEMAMDAEIEVHHDVAHKPVMALQRVSDALPGIGIVAAVLGIVVTMQSIAGPVEEIGHHVASALVGTFLGILFSYGVFNPIGTSIEFQNSEESRYFHVLKSGVVAFAKGLPPIVAVEFARKAISAEVRPSFVQMESACKALKKEKAA